MKSDATAAEPAGAQDAAKADASAGAGSVKRGNARTGANAGAGVVTVTTADASKAGTSGTKAEPKAESKADAAPARKAGTRAGNETPRIKSVTPLQKTDKIELLLEQQDFLKLDIVPEDGDSDETALSADIVARMRGAISSADIARIVEDDADLYVTVRSVLALVDRDADYYRFNCTVDLEMKSADGKRLFGATKLSLGSPRRVLGKETAVASFAGPAANSSVEWCRKVLKRIIDGEIGAALVTVQLPTVPQRKKRDLQMDAVNIVKIGDALAKQKNILKYELVSQDSESGLCLYRVVYVISEYPNGLVNELRALFSASNQK